MSTQFPVMVPSPRESDRLDWARRFAHRLIAPGGADQGCAAAGRIRAEERLRALFDAVYRQANDALEYAGVAARIGLTGSPHLRLYAIQGADGTERDLTLHIMVTAEEDQLSGGAFVGSSVSPVELYLVPVIAHGEPRWRVEPSGIAFTATMVHDLFLYIFTDDAAAGARLSPYMQRDQRHGAA